MARRIYGLMAEFEDATALVEATERAHAAGYRRMDAYSPFPIEQLHHAMGSPHSRLPLIVLIGGIVGCVGGFLLQYWASAIAYPINVGGRPLNSWPAFIPVTFELTVLGASTFAVFGMLALNKLPQPHCPLFTVERFKRASDDKFFLCIESSDKKFNLADATKFLEGIGAKHVTEVRDED
jgi:hypothetical protein